MQVGGTEAITVQLDGGAGGATRLAGDYTYGDLRLPYRDAGMWGMFRVYRCVSDGAGLVPLDPGTSACEAAADGSAVAERALAGALFAIAVVIAVLGLRYERAIRKRRRSPSKRGP